MAKKKAPKKQPQQKPLERYLDDALVKQTGDGVVFWMNWIGHAIARHCVESERFPGRHEMTGPGWLEELVKEVWDRSVKILDDPRYDENIVCSRLLSLILTMWSCRIIHAKSWDPRRPVEDRKRMAMTLLANQRALMDCLFDYTEDYVLFPDQPWENPFSPNATDGDWGKDIERVLDQEKKAEEEK